MRDVCINPADFTSWLQLFKSCEVLEIGVPSDVRRRTLQRIQVLTCSDADRLCEVGIELAALGISEEAFRIFARALILKPHDADFYSNLANVIQERELISEAIHLYERGLCISREDPVIVTNLGRCLMRTGITSAALHEFDRASCLAPEHFLARYNNGTLLMDLSEFRRGVFSLRRACIQRPDSFSAIWNLGLCLLATGDFAEGWLGYEARFEAGAVVPQCDSAKSIFKSVVSADDRVLVWAEQGVGDEVMFGSMLGEFRGMVGKLLVQLDRRLIPLFRRSLPDDVEFFERGTVVPEDRYDSHIAIGSLGQYLRPTLESFAGKGGKYLWADPDRVHAMRAWLSVQEGERVIGLSWRSSNPETGAARSLALSDLVKSLQAPGVRFVNLQYGDVAAEIEALERDEGIEVLQCPGLDTTDDLDGLAALIEACDEVVSIGNATAHLAGALGKKTTVLLPKARSWRWLSESRDTPWYQSALLLRKQTEDQSWSNFLKDSFYGDVRVAELG